MDGAVLIRVLRKVGCRPELYVTTGFKAVVSFHCGDALFNEFQIGVMVAKALTDDPDGDEMLAALPLTSIERVEKRVGVWCFPEIGWSAPMDRPDPAL